VIDSSGIIKNTSIIRANHSVRHESDWPSKNLMTKRIPFLWTNDDGRRNIYSVKEVS